MGVVLLPSYGVERGVRQGKRPRGKGAVQDTPTTLRPSRREVAH